VWPNCVWPKSPIWSIVLLASAAVYIARRNEVKFDKVIHVAKMCLPYICMSCIYIYIYIYMCVYIFMYIYIYSDVGEAVFTRPRPRQH